MNARELAAVTEVQSLLDGAVSAGVPGISAAIATCQGVIWTGTAGAADLETGAPMQSEMLLGIGSITKTFVAVVVLQLIEERRLDLGDTASYILGAGAEDVPNATKATIAQLLSHTSGVPSWEDDPRWIRHGRGDSGDTDRIWNKEETLAYIKGALPLADPGTTYSYSNTNYTLLGLIIEKLCESEAMDEIRNRILVPLQLNDITLDGFELVPPQRLPRRYHWATPQFRDSAGVNAAFRQITTDLIDVSTSNLSVEWLAGGLIATARDLATYGLALRDGRLLEPSSMAFMTSWLPVGNGVHVGHNLIRTEYPGGLSVVGHDGGVLGSAASLYWIEGTDAIVAVLTNVGSMHSGELPEIQRLPGKQRALIESSSRLAEASDTAHREMPYRVDRVTP